MADLAGFLINMKSLQYKAAFGVIIAERGMALPDTFTVLHPLSRKRPASEDLHHYRQLHRRGRLGHGSR
jgi:hypothetical protein